MLRIESDVSKLTITPTAGALAIAHEEASQETALTILFDRVLVHRAREAARLGWRHRDRPDRGVDAKNSVSAPVGHRFIL